MSSMNVLGSGISLLLLLIGVLNFINVMVTGVYSRRQELAVLESIGMTKRQISGMLTWEGFYYALFTAGCMLTLGNGVLYLISKAVVQIADYTVFSYPFAGRVPDCGALCRLPHRTGYRIPHDGQGERNTAAAPGGLIHAPKSFGYSKQNAAGGIFPRSILFVAKAK